LTARQGDFLLLNYTLKVKESGETVDTTYEAVAKSAHIHSGDAVYRPKFIILGEGWMPKGLEESLVGLEAGNQTTIELTPDRGYGARDPSKMRLVPLRRFREKGIDPIPGGQVELDGRPAVVRAVGAGRVQVDYNHPLAGRTLVYDVSIERVIEEDPDKILNIISRRVPEVSSDKFVLDQHDRDLTIEVPEEAFYLSGIQVAKKAIASDLQKYLPRINTISFLETFKKLTSDTEPGTLSEPAKENVPQPALEAETPPDEQKGVIPEQKAQPAKRRATSQRRKASVAKARKRAMAGSENQR
jgi:FKBP-type peptidyl-prolyl cis-trans isomerase SlyD